MGSAFRNDWIRNVLSNSEDIPERETTPKHIQALLSRGDAPKVSPTKDQLMNQPLKVTREPGTAAPHMLHTHNEKARMSIGEPRPESLNNEYDTATQISGPPQPDSVQWKPRVCHGPSDSDLNCSSKPRGVHKEFQTYAASHSPGYLTGNEAPHSDSERNHAPYDQATTGRTEFHISHHMSHHHITVSEPFQSDQQHTRLATPTLSASTNEIRSKRPFESFNGQPGVSQSCFHQTYGSEGSSTGGTLQSGSNFLQSTSAGMHSNTPIPRIRTHPDHCVADIPGHPPPIFGTSCGRLPSIPQVQRAQLFPFHSSDPLPNLQGSIAQGIGRQRNPSSLGQITDVLQRPPVHLPQLPKLNAPQYTSFTGNRKSQQRNGTEQNCRERQGAILPPLPLPSFNMQERAKRGGRVTCLFPGPPSQGSAFLPSQRLLSNSLRTGQGLHDKPVKPVQESGCISPPTPLPCGTAGNKEWRQSQAPFSSPPPHLGLNKSPVDTTKSRSSRSPYLSDQRDCSFPSAHLPSPDIETPKPPKDNLCSLQNTSDDLDESTHGVLHENGNPTPSKSPASPPFPRFPGQKTGKRPHEGNYTSSKQPPGLAPAVAESIEMFKRKKKCSEKERFIRKYEQITNENASEMSNFFDRVNQSCISIIVNSRIPYVKDTLIEPTDDETPEDAQQKLLVKMKFVEAMEKLQDEQLPKKRRGNLPKESTAYLKRWFDDHCDYPYPTDEQKIAMSKAINIGVAQISHWFINHRKRVWKPNLSSAHPALKVGNADTSSRKDHE